MKAFLIQMATDTKLTLRNVFFWITVVFLVLIVVSVDFLLPKEIKAKPITVAHYGLELPGDLKLSGPQAQSVAQLEEMVQKDSNTIGVYQNNGQLIALVNNLSRKQTAVALSSILPTKNSTPIQYTHTSKPIAPPPFNKRMVPLLISCEAVLTGILLAGVIMLAEKSNQITRAYRVSPAGPLSYVLSKTVLFSVTGMIYAVLIAILTVGFDFHFGSFLFLSFLASALFTLLGIAVTVFFQSISNWLMMMAFLIGTNTLAMFAYLFPSISMDFMKPLPAYTVIFAYEKVMFGTGGFTGNSFGILALEAVVLFAICLICVRFRLLRPHKGE